jgi:putative membrane protein
MQATDHFHDHERDHHHDHGGETLEAVLKTGLLLGLGLYFLYNIVSGSLVNYINARFAWLSYLAVVLFLLLGVSSAYDVLKPGKRKHKHDDHAHDHHHDHDHAHLSWAALAIIAIPLVLGTLIPSQPLGADAVGGSISVNAVSNGSNWSAFTTNPLEWNVLDWLRAFNNSEDAASFNGQQADVIGFVYKEPTFGENQFMVARFTISCCVADASAIGLPVAWQGTSALPQDTWVRVQGAFEVGEFQGDSLPILQAASVETVAQPEHPYLYP